MAPVFKADGFIWLIVGVFWVIAQIAGAAAKKNPPRRPTQSGDNPKTPSIDPFAELLRKLSEAQQIEVPQPEYDELPEETTPAFVPQNAWRQSEIEKLPDMEPLRREPVVQEPEPVNPAQEISIRPTMKAFRNTLPAMKLPAMTLRFQPLEKPAGKIPMLVKIIEPSDKKSLRRAMLNHIVLSKPRGTDQWIPGTVE